MIKKNSTGVVKIGGVDYPYEILYEDVLKCWKVFNATYSLCLRAFKKTNGYNFDVENKDHSLTIPNDLYFWIVWRCLVKTGKWFWKKPFKSINQMKKNIRQDEFQLIVDLAGRDILELKWYEDRESGNVVKEPQ